MSNLKRDRHKPGRLVRIPEPMMLAIEELAARNITTLTHEIVKSVRLRLEVEKLWPRYGQDGEEVPLK